MSSFYVSSPEPLVRIKIKKFFTLVHILYKPNLHETRHNSGVGETRTQTTLREYVSVNRGPKEFWRVTFTTL